VCERTHVMYSGRFVETGTTSDLFADPTHPYTVGLLASVPRLDVDRPQRLVPIPGLPPDMRDVPDHCMFAPRCPRATDVCHQQLPLLEERGAPGHRSACFHPVGHDDPEGTP
jgi:oligopeptide/dipeptide ABC transporter ATP-binding protein